MAKPTTKSGWSQAKGILNSSFYVLERIGILIAIAGFIYYLVDRDLQVQEARDSRIINAWTVLTTEAPGNSGKTQALETLYNFLPVWDSYVDLTGIDLSCDRMGRCPTPTVLTNVDLARKKDRYAYLSLSSFKHARLFGANFTGANLERADLSYAYLGWANLTDVNLANANLKITQFFNTNVSGIKLCDPRGCAKDIEQDQFKDAWVWDDMPLKSGNLDIKPGWKCSSNRRPDYLSGRVMITVNQQNDSREHCKPNT